MKHISETSIEKASIEDTEEILYLQKIAYLSEAEIIDDFTIPPLHQTIEEIISEFKNLVFLKGVFGEKIIGSVRTHMVEGTCHIGKLIVSVAASTGVHQRNTPNNHLILSRKKIPLSPRGPCCFLC